MSRWDILCDRGYLPLSLSHFTLKEGARASPKSLKAPSRLSNYRQLTEHNAQTPQSLLSLSSSVTVIHLRAVTRSGIWEALRATL